jgi:hypothetical protein
MKSRTRLRILTQRKGHQHMAMHAISEEIRSNFHLFWDNFPFPVMLVHKDRTILDHNKAGEAVGYAPGTRCADIGNKEDHRGCLANKALQEQAAKRVVGYIEAAGAVFDSYWIPLAGSEDIYLHFFTDITEYAADRLFPAKCGGESTECGSCSCG